jgi:hypothetical protein
MVALILVVAGAMPLIKYLGDRDWDEAVAEADRLDPGWKVAELEARRAPIADDENSARRVFAAYALLPAAWPSWPALTAPEIEALHKDFRVLAPTAPLTAQQVAGLNDAWAEAAEAVASVRMLKGLPAGRIPVANDPDGMTILGEHQRKVRRLAELLAYDVLLRQHDDDADGALESCRSVVNLARCCGDAPDFI